MSTDRQHYEELDFDLGGIRVRFAAIEGSPHVVIRAHDLDPVPVPLYLARQLGRVLLAANDLREFSEPVAVSADGVRDDSSDCSGLAGGAQAGDSAGHASNVQAGEAEGHVAGLGERDESVDRVLTFMHGVAVDPDELARNVRRKANRVLSGARTADLAQVGPEAETLRDRCRECGAVEVAGEAGQLDAVGRVVDLSHADAPSVETSQGASDAPVEVDDTVGDRTDGGGAPLPPLPSVPGPSEHGVYAGPWPAPLVSSQRWGEL